MNRVLSKQDLPDLEALEAFAGRLACALRAPLVVYLEGPLGAGKTTLVRGVLSALGYPGRVKSPTYGLMEHYDVKGFSVFHLDLYRVEDQAELEYLALRDVVGEDAVLFIEWPAHGGGAIPPADIEIRFSNSVVDRALSVCANTTAGASVLAAIPGR